MRVRDAQTCKPCPIGTYSDTTTNVTRVSDCKKCPKGTKGMASIEGGGTSLFRDGNIVPACEARPFGYKQPLAGMSYCQKCGRDVCACSSPRRTRLIAADEYAYALSDSVRMRTLVAAHWQQLSWRGWGTDKEMNKINLDLSLSQ